MLVMASVVVPVLAPVMAAVLATVSATIVPWCNVANMALVVSTMASLPAMNVVARVVSLSTVDVARIA